MLENVSKLKNLLTSAKQIVITTHRGPDGDAMGSSLAMFHFLEQLGHSVSVITPNEYAHFLHWMPGNQEVLVYEGNEEEAVNKETIKQALSKLNKRERRIIYLRFYGGLSQSEIAKRLNLSQMHISRLLIQIIKKLKKQLTYV